MKPYLISAITLILLPLLVMSILGYKTGHMFRPANEEMLDYYKLLYGVLCIGVLLLLIGMVWPLIKIVVPILDPYITWKYFVMVTVATFLIAALPLLYAAISGSKDAAATALIIPVITYYFFSLLIGLGITVKIAKIIIRLSA